LENFKSQRTWKSKWKKLWLNKLHTEITSNPNRSLLKREQLVDFVKMWTNYIWQIWIVPPSDAFTLLEGSWKAKNARHNNGNFEMFEAFDSPCLNDSNRFLKDEWIWRDYVQCILYNCCICQLAIFSFSLRDVLQNLPICKIETPPEVAHLAMDPLHEWPLDNLVVFFRSGMISSSTFPTKKGVNRFHYKDQNSKINWMQE
jgi:hypothetical protein